MPGWRMDFLICVAGSVRTELFVISAPVPLVVGMAAKNGRSVTTSSREPLKYSMQVPSRRDNAAAAFAVSITLPPPTATTASAFHSRIAFTALLTAPGEGSVIVSAKTRTWRPTAVKSPAIAFASVSAACLPATISTRLAPRGRCGASFDAAPGPNTMSRGVWIVKDGI